MDNVSKTLYIPLYGKALVSRMGRILADPTAEAIWDAEGFPLSGKAASKWLAYYMGMRSAVFDRWTAEVMAQYPDAAVLHLGCGLDSRCRRVNSGSHRWYDVDFPEVIAERKQYYSESEDYRMIPADVRDSRWLRSVFGSAAIVVMEGISMYLSPADLQQVLHQICQRFDRVYLLMDCYTTLAAKVSRYKNPINQVGVTTVYGLDDPLAVKVQGLTFRKEWNMTPDDLIAQLPPKEQKLFRKLYAGRFSKKLYRLYEYEK